MDPTAARDFARPAAALRRASAMAAILLAPALAQEPKVSSGYPGRDVLSPFRDPAEIVAPPDELFAHLRVMRQIADDPAAVKSFDDEGRETVDDDLWRTARGQAERIGIDAGMLAVQMRDNRNADERALAFYGAFYCANVDYVFNLIAHIPGEPVQRTRERAYPRAVAFLRAHLGRRFGDLSKDQQDAITATMPQIGSPAAKAQGITRAPRADDALHSVNLQPFLQLLDLDSDIDLAQGLWFLKEACAARRDLALRWLEPALPRIRQLLRTGSAPVRREALGLFGALAEQGTPPDLAEAAACEAFAEAASKAMFPPVRRISDGLFWLLPGAERDAIVAAGVEALQGERIGSAAYGKTAAGAFWRGFRVERVPAALAPLGIEPDMVITAINGTPVNDAKSLLSVLDAQFHYLDRSEKKEGVRRRKTSATLLVELQVGDETRVIEYRVR